MNLSTANQSRASLSHANVFRGAAVSSTASAANLASSTSDSIRLPSSSSTNTVNSLNSANIQQAVMATAVTSPVDTGIDQHLKNETAHNTSSHPLQTQALQSKADFKLVLSSSKTSITARSHVQNEVTTSAETNLIVPVSPSPRHDAALKNQTQTYNLAHTDATDSAQLDNSQTKSESAFTIDLGLNLNLDLMSISFFISGVLLMIYLLHLA